LIRIEGLEEERVEEFEEIHIVELWIEIFEILKWEVF